jgi:histidinol-phosphate/aromatic aminotransferase/cobyric acid decarboxylase-like protein
VTIVYTIVNGGFAANNPVVHIWIFAVARREPLAVKGLEEARLNVAHAFERIGMQLFVEPEAGMFLWARFPNVDDALTLTDSAAKNGTLLRTPSRTH